MSTAQEVQSLLRFLSHDAKVPLAQALSKVKALQDANFITASDISKSDFERLKGIFEDEKVARQVLNAAKRVCKKRTSSDASTVAVAPSPKKAKQLFDQPLTPAEFEASLALPEPELDEEKLQAAAIHTNRAPLVLAFACTLLKFTMPEQPVSSRLSLAQAVVSMNSKNKALHIGIDSGQAAEDEGWGEGQPIVRIMTRDVRVMKRWGYEWEEESSNKALGDSTQGTLDWSQATLEDEAKPKDPPLWAIDLEALKKANQPGAIGSYKGSTSQLPIYTAQSARAYLLKAFDTPKTEGAKVEGASKTKRTNTSMAAEKARNLSLLLGALELLYRSWAPILNKDDLDKRAWGWYVRTRPTVAHGPAGWGGKGDINLSDILELRRSAG